MILAPLNTSPDDLQKRARALGRIADYLNKLPLCHLRNRYSKADADSVERAQLRLLTLCADENDRAAMAEVLLDFFIFAIDEFAPRFSLDNLIWKELAEVGDGNDVHAAVVQRLWVDPPKNNGSEAFSFWLLEQTWGGRPLVALLDEERRRRGWSEEIAAVRLGVAQGVSGRYEDDGVTLAAAPRWGILVALDGLRKALAQPAEDAKN